MALMYRLGYKGLSMRELQPYLTGEKQGRVFGITFDDGYVDNLTNALPVLQQYGFSSTCYLVAGMLGKENVWDKEFKDPHALMSVEQVEQWLQGGQDIGAHTVQHVNLKNTSPTAAKKEVKDSKTALEEVFKRSVTDFCYPYGAYTEEIVQVVRTSGFSTATTTERRVVDAMTDSMFLLPRLFINNKITRLKLAWRLFRSHFAKGELPA
jgi:peptidoglycan/xylan/chitin deacetylase (PgdA/CDA1 family)